MSPPAVPSPCAAAPAAARRACGTDARRHRFEALVGPLTDDLFRYACWLCGDRQLAQDLVQETCLRAWRALDDLNEPGAVKAWLITTLRRERARLYERKRLDVAADVEAPSVADTAGGGPDHEVERLLLRDRIRDLPPGYREPLALQVLLGYSIREIAGATEQTEGAVMTRLFRARQMLLAAPPARGL